MSTTLRLLRIETRRTVAVWLLLPTVALSWLISNTNSFLIWAEVSLLVRNAAGFAGPFAGGAAAWMGGRDRRRGLDDLLATTPRPAWSRQLATWAATTTWGVLAYAAVGACLVTLTALRATWGAPVLWPMIVGLLAIPAHGAIGFVLGQALPNRFIPPLVAIGLFFAQVFVSVATALGLPDWIVYLSPMAFLDSSVWFGVRPNVGLPQAVFLLGLTGLALGVLIVRDRRGPAVQALLIVSVGLVVAGAALLIERIPKGGTDVLYERRHNTPIAQQAGVIPYTPACSSDPLPVCVHPAYQPLLRAESAAINRLVAPVLGLPGAPTRVEQGPSALPGMVDRVMLFDPRRPFGDDRLSALLFVMTLVRDSNAYNAFIPPAPSSCPGGDPLRCVEAQDAIALWLLQQAGINVALDNINSAWLGGYSGVHLEAVAAAVQRFAALDPAQQQEWLRAHFADLRMGKVRLEDLP